MTSTKVALADIHRSLLAFAEGISEQPLTLESIPAASESSESAAPNPATPESTWPTTWRWMSELAPTTIALPESIDYFDSQTTDDAIDHRTGRPSNRKLYRSLVLRHIGLQQLGAYHWFTTHPKLPVASAFGDPKRPQLLIDLFDLCEEARVTAILRRQYPGARTDLDQLHSWARSQLGSHIHATATATATARITATPFDSWPLKPTRAATSPHQPGDGCNACDDPTRPNTTACL